MKKEYNMLYDRQVQIFGEKVQRSILNSLISVQDLNISLTEIIKNCVLMGFNINLNIEYNKNIKLHQNQIENFFFIDDDEIVKNI